MYNSIVNIFAERVKLFLQVQSSENISNICVSVYITSKYKLFKMIEHVPFTVIKSSKFKYYQLGVTHKLFILKIKITFVVLKSFLVYDVDDICHLIVFFVSCGAWDRQIAVTTLLTQIHDKIRYVRVSIIYFLGAIFKVHSKDTKV